MNHRLPIYRSVCNVLLILTVTALRVRVIFLRGAVSFTFYFFRVTEYKWFSLCCKYEVIARLTGSSAVNTGSEISKRCFCFVCKANSFMCWFDFRYFASIYYCRSVLLCRALLPPHSLAKFSDSLPTALSIIDLVSNLHSEFLFYLGIFVILIYSFNLNLFNGFIHHCVSMIP